MDLEFKKQIEERMQEIPEALAKAIKVSGWEKIVFDIGRKHSLHVDDIGQLQNELIMVLVGIVHPDEFRSVVVNEIGISADKAGMIIEEINTQVNEKIKNALKSEINHEEIITESDHEVMRKAGVGVGESLLEEDKKEEVGIEEEEEVSVSPSELNKITPNPVKVGVSPEVPAPQVKTPAPSQIFKSKTSEISAEGKPKGFFDPYREPVE